MTYGSTRGNYLAYGTGAPRTNIGALWSKQSKKGEPYMSGYIEVNGAKIEVIVFSNRQKREDKQPDYRIFPKEKREYQAREPERNQDELNDLDNAPL